MKTKLAIVLSLTSLAAYSSWADPVVVVQTPGVVIQPAPVVVVSPAVTVSVGVPDSYTWDGTEYVGVVGTQYYYLGPNHAWLAFDAPRLARFHEWERNHADWRVHAIRNDKYRNDAHGHVVPFHDVHGGPDVHPRPDMDHGDHADHGHDGDDHHDHH